jgi:hypothetical protein
LRFCVLLNDLDLNLHMNNGRYLSVCDLGKIDVMIRSGTASIAIRRKWRPLIGGSHTGCNRRMALVRWDVERRRDGKTGAGEFSAAVVIRIT